MTASMQGPSTRATAEATWHVAPLQRKCACGGSAGMDGECEACRRKDALGLQARLVVGAGNDPLEREADRAADHVLGRPEGGVALTNAAGRLSRRPAGTVTARPVPASVTTTLRASGEPLPAATRHFFETRFGHDFGHVRVHHDAAAAASARDVAAHAYTVGHQVVFNQGRYAPAAPAGQALLAHELAHVVQQTGTLQRSAIAPEPEVRANPPEDEALRPPEPPAEENETPQAEAAGGHGGPASALYPPPIDSSIEGAPLPHGMDRDALEAERACIATTPPDPVECDPVRALTWADFSGAAPRRSRFGAMTASDLRERAINTALARCAPYTQPQTRGVQAFFIPGRSWVKPEFANAGNAAHNGCHRIVGQCQAFFDREARAGRAGGSFGMSAGAPRGCPAGAQARGDQAHSRAQCATLVARDCHDTRVAESGRLLRHEQGHFNLSCAMARKANGMLAAAPNFAQLLRSARRVLSQQQRRYDAQTRHGCIAAAQARWEADIAAGLPRVNIPVGRRRGGRGRRR